MFTDPKENLKELGLHKGAKVADLGAGAGHYSLEAAREVAPDGVVYCVDVQKEMLASLKRDAESKGVENLEVIWGDIEEENGTTLKDDSVDACILTSVLFMAEDKEGLAKESYRILRKGGRLLLIDWIDSFDGLGPHRDQVVTREMAESLMIGQGFNKVSEFDAGNHHYGMIFVK